MSTFEELGEQKEVQLPQGTVRYRECGSGEPLVFIHGLLVNGDLWRKVVPTLAKNYRCIAPDLPLGAHSLALNADADLTPPGIARLIADFLVALDLSSVTLVANDTGGAFTQIAITEYPERVERLVLTNCDAYDNFLPLSIRAFEWFAYVPGFVALLGQLCKLSFVQQLIIKLVAKHPVDARAGLSYMQPITTNKGVQRDVGKVLRGISTRYTNIAASKLLSSWQSILLMPGLDCPTCNQLQRIKGYSATWGRCCAASPHATPISPPANLETSTSLSYWSGQAKISSSQRSMLNDCSEPFPMPHLHYVKDSYAFVSEDQPEQLAQHIETFVGV